MIYKLYCKTFRNDSFWTRSIWEWSGDTEADTPLAALRKTLDRLNVYNIVPVTDERHADWVVIGEDGTKHYYDTLPS